MDPAVHRTGASAAVPTSRGLSRGVARPRPTAGQPARLLIGDLLVPGRVTSASTTSVFFRTDVLIELGERGLLSLPGSPLPVPVRVVSTTTATSRRHAAMRLAFDLDGDASERRALASLLRRLARHRARR